MSRPNEHVRLQLLFSNCVPKLTYGAAVKDFSATEKQRYNVALNNAIRRISHTIDGKAPIFCVNS